MERRTGILAKKKREKGWGVVHRLVGMEVGVLGSSDMS